MLWDSKSWLWRLLENVDIFVLAGIWTVYVQATSSNPPMGCSPNHQLCFQSLYLLLRTALCVTPRGQWLIDQLSDYLAWGLGSGAPMCHLDSQASYRVASPAPSLGNLHGACWLPGDLLFHPLSRMLAFQLSCSAICFCNCACPGSKWWEDKENKKQQGFTPHSWYHSSTDWIGRIPPSGFWLLCAPNSATVACLGAERMETRKNGGGEGFLQSFRVWRVPCTFFKPESKAFSRVLSVCVLMPTSRSQAVLRLGILKEKDSKLTASSEVLQILLSFLDLPTTMCFLEFSNAILSRFHSCTEPGRDRVKCAFSIFPETGPQFSFKYKLIYVCVN